MSAISLCLIWSKLIIFNFSRFVLYQSNTKWEKPFNLPVDLIFLPLRAILLAAWMDSFFFGRHIYAFCNNQYVLQITQGVFDLLCIPNIPSGSLKSYIHLKEVYLVQFSFISNNITYYIIHISLFYFNGKL